MKVNVKRLMAAFLSSAMVASTVVMPVFAEETDIKEVNAEENISLMAAATIGISKSEGWMEAAVVEWKPTANSNVAEYEVAYSKDGTNFTEIDTELIRKYPNNRWRADILGLSAGNYTIKVSAKDANDAVIDTETASVTVVAQDRTGFTFSPKSKFYDKGACGAYNADGTLKSDATVLYITEGNFDTITLGLKDKAGKAYTAVGLADICNTMGAAASKGVKNPPLAVRFIGTIGDSHNGLEKPQILQTKCDKIAAVNITFEGVGNDAMFYGLALRLNGAANVEIRNLAFFNWHDDAIQLQGNGNSNHWIHNNDLFYGENHGGDQKKGDGATDVKDDSQYITYSYNHYWDSGKTSLCGMKSETGDNYITYQHNWFDHSDSRHPRIRTMFVHVYNNYYDGNSKYGVGAAKSSSAFVEGNYFRNCKHPILTSKQGSDIRENDSGVSNYQGKGTFSGEDGGVVKAYNNHVEGANVTKNGQGMEPIYYDAADTSANGKSTQYDAYLAKSRDEQVPSTVKALLGGKVFDNSNVDAYILSIPVEEPAVAKDKVTKYAGRVGSHFVDSTGFAFNNAVDDASYDINTTLESKLKTYFTDKSDDYVSIGGLTNGSVITEPITQATTTKPENPTQGTTTKPENPTQGTTSAPVAGTYTHNFSTDGTSGSFYTISGSMKADTFNISYNGLTLTKGLKMESATNIKFTAPSAGKLVIVTDTASKNIKIDNNKIKTDAKGILEMDVTAGAHTITKGDSINVFYISLSTSGEVPPEESTEVTTEESTEATTTVPVGQGEAQTNAASGVSTVYDKATNTWTLTDTSSTDAAELTIPFEAKSEGVVVVSAKLTPSTVASKWSLMQIKGTNSDGVESEIISFGSDGDKKLSVRNGGTAYISLGKAMETKTYNVSIALNLNKGTADVVVDGVKESFDGIDVEEVGSLYFVTSKGGSRNLTVADLTVGMAVESSTKPVTPVDKGLDFSEDSKIAADDVVSVAKAARSGSTDLSFDLNNDGVVNNDDAKEFLNFIRHNDYKIGK